MNPDEESGGMTNPYSNVGGAHSTYNNQTPGLNPRVLSASTHMNERLAAYEEQVAEQAVDLIFNNKVNSKNAFEVDNKYVGELHRIVKKKDEASWLKASATLDASAKIYGFRVDAVHNDAYKMVGGLYRSAKNDDEEGKGGEDRGEDGEGDDPGPGGSRPRRKLNMKVGENTLEKDQSKLLASKFDLQFEIDPLFTKSAARFDEGGAKGMLLNHLLMDKETSVIYDSSDFLKSYLKHQEGEENRIPEESLNTGLLSKDELPHDNDAIEFSEKVFSGIEYDILRKTQFLRSMSLFKASKLGLESRGIGEGIGFGEDEREMGAARIAADYDNMLSPDVDELNDPPYPQPEHGLSDDDVDIDDETQNPTINNRDSRDLSDLRKTDLEVLAERMQLGHGRQDPKFIEENLARFGDGNIDHYNQYFDPKLLENWQDLKQWKVDFGAREKKEKSLKKKENVILGFEFDENLSMSIEDIMDKTEARVEHRNAPTQREYINDIEKCSIQKDCQFPMYRLTSLFSRPLIMKVYAGNKKQGGEQGIQLGNLVDDLGQIDGDPDAIPQLIETYDVYNLGLGPTQQLEFQIKGYSKVFNVKKLKENIWKYVEEKLRSGEPLTFVGVLWHINPRGNDENFSLQSVLVCLLHISNEKGINLVQEAEERSDFTITGDEFICQEEDRGGKADNINGFSQLGNGIIQPA